MFALAIIFVIFIYILVFTILLKITKNKILKIIIIAGFAVYPFWDLIPKQAFRYYSCKFEQEYFFKSNSKTKGITQESAYFDNAYDLIELELNNPSDKTKRKIFTEISISPAKDLITTAEDSFIELKISPMPRGGKRILTEDHTLEVVDSIPDERPPKFVKLRLISNEASQCNFTPPLDWHSGFCGKKLCPALLNKCISISISYKTDSNYRLIEKIQYEKWRETYSAEIIDGGNLSTVAKSKSFSFHDINLFTGMPGPSAIHGYCKDTNPFRRTTMLVNDFFELKSSTTK